MLRGESDFQHEGGKTGIVKLTAAPVLFNVSTCKLWLPLKAVASELMFGLLLNVAPSNPMLARSADNLSQPVRPAVMMVSNRGAVRGKLLDSTLRNWHEADENVKLKAFSPSS